MLRGKVGIGAVWDVAVEAVRGRLGLLVPIAALTLFLPSVIQAALALYTGGASGEVVVSPGGGGASLRFALMLGLLALTFWGALAITAITGDPAVGASEARRRASARLLPLLGVSLVIGLALTPLIAPVFLVLLLAGVNMLELAAGTMPALPAGTALLIISVGFAVALLALWLFARLLPLVPVVLNERLGLRAIGRSFRLTRGLGLKLAGALLLYGIVLFVASSAAQWVTFIPFRLILGAENTGVARFIGAVAGALVGAVFSLLAYAFAAQLYDRLVAGERAARPEDAHPAA